MTAPTLASALACGVMLGACDFPRPANIGGSDASVDTMPVDAPDADGPTRCDPKSRFGTPVPIPELATTGFAEVGPRLSPDELTVYFYGITATSTDIYVAHRNAVTEPFDTPKLNTALSSSEPDYDVSVSSNGLTLFLASIRAPSQNVRLFVTTRMSKLAEFDPPQLAATVNAPDPLDGDGQPFLTADSKELWFGSNRAGGVGGGDVWRAVATANGFLAPMNVRELNSNVEDGEPVLSADRLTVYFYSARPGPRSDGKLHIWRSQRAILGDGFPPPAYAAELNSDFDETPGWLSLDDCRLYLSTNRGKGPDDYDIYVATRQP
jgi:hypothetical protein